MSKDTPEVEINKEGGVVIKYGEEGKEEQKFTTVTEALQNLSKRVVDIQSSETKMKTERDQFETDNRALTTLNEEILEGLEEKADKPKEKQAIANLIGDTPEETSKNIQDFIKNQLKTEKDEISKATTEKEQERLELQMKNWYDDASKKYPELKDTEAKKDLVDFFVNHNIEHYFKKHPDFAEHCGNNLVIGAHLLMADLTELDKARKTKANYIASGGGAGKPSESSSADFYKMTSEQQQAQLDKEFEENLKKKTVE